MSTKKRDIDKKLFVEYTYYMPMINDDANSVPPNTIAVFGYQKDKTYPSLKSLKGEKQRDWFEKPYYYCLPITFANQLGFVVISLFDFSLHWDGETGIEHLKITSDKIVEDGVFGDSKQKVYSYFGNGVFTVSHDFTMRTPHGVNLYISQPPNYFIPGVTTMSALVEADNLIRDFTFSLKVTVPNIDIHIKKGDMLAMILPIPRYFPDSFELKNAMDLFSIPALRGTLQGIVDHAAADAALAEQRGTFGGIMEDEKRELGIYYKGVDPYGNQFKEHQRNPLNIEHH